MIPRLCSNSTLPADRDRVWLSVNSSYSHASLALPLLHATCLQQGDDSAWHQVECTADAPVSLVVADIAGLNPGFLLATCYLFSLETVLKICRRVKTLSPRVRIILGGPEFLGGNVDFLKREAVVDAVVRGEGEGVVYPLLTCFESGGIPSGLPGVCFRDHQGRVQDDGTTAPELPFERLPDPLSSPFFSLSGPFVQLESSRGCPGNCTFCTSCKTTVRNGDCAVLTRQLRTVQAAGVHEVRLIDRTFNASPSRCITLLEMFRCQFPDLRFHLEMHPAFLPPRVREALTQAPPGQLHIEAGIQSSAAPVLEHSCRAGGSKRIWDGIQYLADSPNLVVHVDFIAGLPGQTVDSLMNDLVKTMSIGPEEIQLESLKVLPGTPLRAQPHGVVFAPDPPYEVLKTATMSAGDLQRLRHVSQVIDRFYNTRELRQPFRAAVCRHGSAWLQAFTEFLLEKKALAQPMALANRFKILHAFALERQHVELRACLEYAWLRWGLSPQHGLIQAKLWKHPLAPDATLAEGKLTDDPVRIWAAEIGDKRYLFVFHRHRNKQPALAVFKISEKNQKIAAEQAAFSTPKLV